MIHTQRHLRKPNTFIHLLKGQENQSMKLSKTKCAIFICKTKQGNRYKMKKMSFNCKLFICKTKQGNHYKMKKWVSIANYSYVHKIMKSLQNEKMSFNCKFFICTQNNEIVTKWKKWVSIANYSYVRKIMKSLQNEKMSFNCKWNRLKCNICFISANGNRKKKIKQKWAKKTANLKIWAKRVRKKFF